MTVKRGYLRYKIIAWSFIPTAFILVGVALIHYASYRQVTQELVMQRNQELARLLANRLGSGLTVYTDLLESLANSLRSSPTGQQAALMDANELLSVFDGGLLVLIGRRVHCSNSRRCQLPDLAPMYRISANWEPTNHQSSGCLSRF
jgi:hypothetical protein